MASCNGANPFDSYALEKMSVLGNARVADGIHLIELSAPDMAGKVKPGQFAHFSVPRFEAHILRRPFSIYDADAKAGTIKVMYQLAGSATKHMTTLVAGEELDAIGPVGSGWSMKDPNGDAPKNALLICGGVGVAPMNMLAHQLIGMGAKVRCAIGAANAGKLVGVEALEAAGIDVSIATDDGSCGEHGFVTDVASKILESDSTIDYIAICGPKPMERVACKIACAYAGVDSGSTNVEVSMENRMACGIGACLSCVVDTVDGLKRACVDGPVFDARKVVW